MRFPQEDFLYSLGRSKIRGSLLKTRTKTYIRYDKENDREKTERRRERERKVEGEI